MNELKEIFPGGGCKQACRLAGLPTAYVLLNNGLILGGLLDMLLYADKRGLAKTTLVGLTSLLIVSLLVILVENLFLGTETEVKELPGLGIVVIAKR